MKTVIIIREHVWSHSLSDMCLNTLTMFAGHLCLRAAGLMSWFCWCLGAVDVLVLLVSWCCWCPGSVDVLVLLMSWCCWYSGTVCHVIFIYDKVSGSLPLSPCHLLPNQFEREVSQRADQSQLRNQSEAANQGPHRGASRTVHLIWGLTISLLHIQVLFIFIWIVSTVILYFKYNLFLVTLHVVVCVPGISRTNKGTAGPSQREGADGA